MAAPCFNNQQTLVLTVAQAKATCETQGRGLCYDHEVIFPEEKAIGGTSDLSLPEGTAEAGWKQRRLALRTERRYFACPKLGNDAGLEGHAATVTVLLWGQRMAEDTGVRAELFVREDSRKDTHVAHCMEIVIAEDSETQSESRPGAGKPPPQAFSRVQPKHWKQTGGPASQPPSHPAKISVLTKPAARPLKL